MKSSGRRVNRWILGIAVATLSIVATWAGESPGQESAPPEKGGVTQSLGMPPVYKGYAGFELQWYRPSQTSVLAGLVNAGLYRDLGSPIIGIAALGLEMYGGVRTGKIDGGGRALYRCAGVGFSGADRPWPSAGSRASTTPSVWVSAYRFGVRTSARLGPRTTP